MQRDREPDAELPAALLDARHDARGRERDAAAREGEAGLVHGEAQRRRGGVVVEERLAHAHDDDVGEEPPVGRPLGHSPSASRATRICAVISGGAEVADQRHVPVWQKRQVSVQPTWVETQSAPRSASGMKTVSTSWPSAKRSSHLAVPSRRALLGRDRRPGDRVALGQPGAQPRRQGRHRGEVAAPRQ